jgi:hypothetical protein
VSAFILGCRCHQKVNNRLGLCSLENGLSKHLSALELEAIPYYVLLGSQNRSYVDRQPRMPKVFGARERRRVVGELSASCRWAAGPVLKQVTGAGASIAHGAKFYPSIPLKHNDDPARSVVGIVPSSR